MTSIYQSEAYDLVMNISFGEDFELPEWIEFSTYQKGLRKNVEIAVLFDETVNDPHGADMAFIRYGPNAFVPKHLHTGYETVLVLKGDYIENNKTFLPGSFILRSPGTCHSMESKKGCLILASRYKPVKQLQGIM